MAEFAGDINTDFGGLVVCDRVREDFGSSWTSSLVKLTLLERDTTELGMYLEGVEAPLRKRKLSWQQNGNNCQSHLKTSKMEEEQRDDRRGQHAGGGRKFGGQNDLGNGGGNGSSGSSHLSPGWAVNDLDLELGGDLAMNEALLSLPSMTVFKQEAPSPPGAEPRRIWQARHRSQLSEVNVSGSADRNGELDVSGQSHRSIETLGAHLHNGQDQNMLSSSYNQQSSNVVDSKGNNALLSGNSSMEYSMAHSSTESAFREDLRFQYVLAAATSITTKTNEETLTYLNQGQSYEIKLKKLGDLRHYKGKILKSIIRICFHERRLQYMEKEQMAQWHSERPGHRILEVDIPLSYGLIQVSQPPTAMNTVELLWDPTKDVGIYIKVNCISTEFTAKKHGGEKGVPFRVQVETYLSSNKQRLNAAACQIKVFKLKGADRKHKQDRERVLRRSRSEIEQLQPSCECTVLSDLPNDAVVPGPPPAVVSSQTEDHTVQNVSTGCSPKPVTQQSVLLNSCGLKSFQDCDVKSCSASPTSILPDLQDTPFLNSEKPTGLREDASSGETRAWLIQNRFSQYEATFANFSGADLLRLSRDDIIQICGLADGIRLYNALHAKMLEPRCVIYVRWENHTDSLYSAVYLHTATANELRDKLAELANQTQTNCEVVVCGPGGARLRLTDELASHIADKSIFTLTRLDGNRLMLAPTTDP